jgi:hypothetical protein
MAQVKQLVVHVRVCSRPGDHPQQKGQYHDETYQEHRRSPYPHNLACHAPDHAAHPPVLLCMLGQSSEQTLRPVTLRGVAYRARQGQRIPQTTYL